MIVCTPEHLIREHVRYLKIFGSIEDYLMIEKAMDYLKIEKAIVIFGSKGQETTKLEPQRITAKNSEVS